MSDINGGTNGPIPHIALTAIIGVLFVFVLGAFFWLLAIAMRVERGYAERHGPQRRGLTESLDDL
jgi:hypothetical protein